MLKSSGIVIACKKKSLAHLGDWVQKDSQMPQLYSIKAGNQNNTLTAVTNDIDEKDIFVLCKQGKSPHTGLWSLQALLQSNQNLSEVNPKIAQCIDDYVLPAEGILGICNKIVILHGTENSSGNLWQYKKLCNCQTRKLWNFLKIAFTWKYLHN